MSNHCPIYAQGRCSCGHRPIHLMGDDAPEKWDRAVDAHIAAMADLGPAMAEEREAMERLRLAQDVFDRAHERSSDLFMAAYHGCAHPDAVTA